MDEAQIARLINFIKSGDFMRFYKSREWMALRLEILKRDNYECKQCKGRGKYKRAELVHHKAEITKRPDLALSKNNLISVCNNCHNEIHGRTPEAFNKSKKKFQNVELW